MGSSTFSALAGEIERDCTRPVSVGIHLKHLNHFLLLVSLLATSASAAHDHHHHGQCAHDTTEQVRGGVRDSGYFFNRNVPYAQRRQLSSSSASMSPIRIELDYSANALTGLDATQQAYLRDDIMPAALAWLRASLSVAPKQTKTVLGSHGRG